MKNKFIGTSPWIFKFGAGCFNIVAFFLTYIGVVKVIKDFGVFNALFAVIGIAAFVVSILTTKTVLKNGAEFYADRVAFSAHDQYNTYYYKDIEKVNIHKDTDPSLKKNFVDRYSSVILHLKDGTVATVELGNTTTKALRDIQKEIMKRTD